jgi:hypothetical protein
MEPWLGYQSPRPVEQEIEQVLDSRRGVNAAGVVLVKLGADDGARSDHCVLGAGEDTHIRILRAVLTFHPHGTIEGGNVAGEEAVLAPWHIRSKNSFFSSFFSKNGCAK